MKILCSLSGIEFTCEHFPGSFYAREVHHPVFTIPQKKLLSYTGKWAAGELTPTDSYLLFLALLHSSELVNFRVPAIRTKDTDAIVAKNMEFLLRTVIKLNTVTNPEEVFPHYVISLDTRTLENVDSWIETWEEAYKDFLSGYVSAHDSAIYHAKLNTRTNALARMIKSPHKKVSDYSHQIADWAAVAGAFPEFYMLNPLTRNNTTCADYWKDIIHRCAKNEFLFNIPDKDLKELIEHCEEYIPIGSIYSNTLFKLLRGASEKKHNFLGLGDFDLTKTTYRILSEQDTMEGAQIQAMVDSAPEEYPRQESYPTKMAFIRAKMRWDMKANISAASPSNTPATEGNDNETF